MGVIESSEGPISDKVIPLYEEMEEIFNSRMGDSNTKSLDKRQNILNISEGGILLEVTDPELIESFYTNLFLRRILRLRCKPLCDSHFISDIFPKPEKSIT